MKIAVLGWGSLIWNKSTLRIKNNEWFEDGPSLPIEFARISGDKRLTLVIKDGVKRVTVLFSESELLNLDEAREDLRLRESTPNIQNIGFINFIKPKYSIKRGEQEIFNTLSNWNKTKKFDAIIWTDLGPNFKNKSNLNFTKENVISYIKSLDQNCSEKAKEYIIKAPLQIQTSFRPFIEDVLK